MTSMMKNRRGALLDDWVEILTIVLLVLGLVISLLSDAAIISYLMIMVCGFVIGRLYYLKRHKMRFPFYVLVLGFLVGYIVGIQIINRGKLIFIIIFFIAGAYLGYYVHQKGYLR